MQNEIKAIGDLVEVNNHRIHIYRCGNINNPTLVFLAGSGTVAPAFDFKVLYQKLSNNFRIVVIEKFGYGYSDICEVDCHIDTLVSIERQSLENLGEKGPFVLVPHSMGGLEAIRWKQKYPDEIKAIIGIDMATPLAYSKWTDKRVEKQIKMSLIAKTLNLHKIPNLYPLNKRCLTKDEMNQQNLLKKRNAFNICYVNEGKKVLSNAEIVGADGNINCPILLFVSNGKQIDKYWVGIQHEFATSVNAKIICYNCGHYIHYYKSNEMSKHIIEFVGKIMFN